MASVDIAEFERVIEQLRLAIEPIVARHRDRGETLTWRLLKRIEQEAVGRLEQMSELIPLYLHMARPSSAGDYPQTDELVDIADGHAIACSYAMIYEEYWREPRNATPAIRLSGRKDYSLEAHGADEPGPKPAHPAGTACSYADATDTESAASTIAVIHPMRHGFAL